MSRQVRYLKRDDVADLVGVGARQASRILQSLPGAECYDGVHYRVRDCRQVRVALALRRIKHLEREGSATDWLRDFKFWAAQTRARYIPLPKLYGAEAYRQLARECDRDLQQMEEVRKFYEELLEAGDAIDAAAQKRSASPRGTARR